MSPEGETFPSFSLPDQHGEEKTLADLSGVEGLVLYVYPKDDTPGCTTEAQEFRDLLEQFQAKGYQVAGLSPDGAESHCKFIDQHALTFPLLTDPDLTFMRAIGAYGEKKLYGKTVEGVIRSTFIVDRDGTLEAAHRNVRAKGHAARVLRDL